MSASGFVFDARFIIGFVKIHIGFCRLKNYKGRILSTSGFVFDACFICIFLCHGFYQNTHWLKCRLKLYKGRSLSTSGFVFDAHFICLFFLCVISLVKTHNG